MLHTSSLPQFQASMSLGLPEVAPHTHTFHFPHTCTTSQGSKGYVQHDRYGCTKLQQPLLHKQCQRLSFQADSTRQAKNQGGP
jgi:hypothetical protein